MDAKKVGKSIAFLRKFYGMTQSDLAEQLGVTDKAVSRWERGHGMPDISLLTKLSIILDTDIESILEGNLTHLELKWKGILNLDYADGIYADTQMFGKCSVYFQLGFLMLAGIKEICIRGKKRDIEFVQEKMGDGSEFGIHLEYEIVPESSLELMDVIHSDLFGRYYSDGGIMLISGLDFLYGKDITKYFRRIIYNSKYPVKLLNFKRKSTSIFFFPHTDETNRFLMDDVIKKKMRTQVMERGVITFPIKTETDLLDAATLIRILEVHQEEKIADLKEIAIRRTLLQGEDITQL